MPRRRHSGNGSDERKASAGAHVAAGAAAKPPGRAAAAVGMGGALNAAWARMFDMVNEAATRAARSPPSFGGGDGGGALGSEDGHASSSPGSSSPGSSSPLSGGGREVDTSGGRSGGSHGIVRHGARKRPRDRARSSAAHSSSHHHEAGDAYGEIGMDQDEEDEPGSGLSRSSSSSSSHSSRHGSRHGSYPRAGHSEHDSSSSGSGGGRGPTFHGFPCPGCGGGVGFNARKCRNCGKLCRYVAGTNAATLTAGSGNSSSSSSGGVGNGSGNSLERDRKGASASGSNAGSSSVRSHKKRPRVGHHLPSATSTATSDASGVARVGSPMRVGTPAAAAAAAAAAKAAKAGTSGASGSSSSFATATATDGSGQPLPNLAEPSALAAAAAARLPRVPYPGSPLYDADGQVIPLMSCATTASADVDGSKEYEDHAKSGALSIFTSQTSSGEPLKSSAAASSPASSPSSSSPTSGATRCSSKSKKAPSTSPGGTPSSTNNSSKSETWAPPTLTEATSKGLALPAHLGPRPELLSPLLAAQVGRHGLRAHIVVLRTESVQKVARPLLSRLMAHPLNRGLFNEPVDADSLALPDYRKIVARPMDLGTVKGKLLCLEYDQIEPFVQDVRQCFVNAKLYNPSTNHVHKAAVAMSDEFEDELKKLAKKLERDEKRRLEHSCSLCMGQECGLCGEKCLKLEPVMMVCSGPCNQRVKRGAFFFITRDGARLWCQKCHTGLSSVLPPTCGSSGDPDLDVTDPDFSPQLFYKRDLLRRCYDEDIPEPWVQCDACELWFHQPCALYNKFYEQSLEQTSAAAQARNTTTTSGDSASTAAAAATAASPPFACPLCRLGAEARYLPKPWLHSARDTFFGALLQSDNNQITSSSSSSSSSPLPLHAKGAPLSGLAAAISSAVGQSSLLSAFSGSPRSSSSSSSSPRSSGEEPPPADRHENKGSSAYGGGSASGSGASGFSNNNTSAGKCDANDEERACYQNGPDPPPVPDEVRWDAAALPTTGLSRFVETKVRARLVELGFAEASETVVLRVISQTERCFAVAPSVRALFPNAKNNNLALPCPPVMPASSSSPGPAKSAGGHESSGNKDSRRSSGLPEVLSYQSKALALFQKQDGADVCLFCMYVQEYGDDDDIPLSNRGTVYISYLDSVEYFRPRTADSSVRTGVYHEVIVAYLAWVRARGFERAHLWACPPQRGNNFIFWCHPTHQRTPNKERLLLWYRAMARVALAEGVVTHVSNFYDEYFAPLLGAPPLGSTDAPLNIPTDGAASVLPTSTADTVSAGVSEDADAEELAATVGDVGSEHHEESSTTLVDGASSTATATTAASSSSKNGSRNRNHRGGGGSKHSSSGKNKGGGSSSSSSGGGSNNRKGGGPGGFKKKPPAVADLELQRAIEAQAAKKYAVSQAAVAAAKKSAQAAAVQAAATTIDASASNASAVMSSSAAEGASSSGIVGAIGSSSGGVGVGDDGVWLPLGSPPPLFEGDYWIDETTRLFALKQRRKVTLAEGATALQLAESLVHTLRQHPAAHAFNQPVDPEALRIPDYFTVIKRPMDLSTVLSKLRAFAYPQVRDLLSDVLLVLENAKHFNPPRHPVHVAACTLKGVYDRELASLRARWQASNAAATSAARERHERVPPIAAFAVASLQPPPLTSSSADGASAAAAAAAASVNSSGSKASVDGTLAPPLVSSSSGAEATVAAAAATATGVHSSASLLSPVTGASYVSSRVRGRSRRSTGGSASAAQASSSSSSSPAASTPSPRAAAAAAAAAAAIAASAAVAGAASGGMSGGDENVASSSESAPTTPRGGLSYRPRSSSMSESTMSDDNDDEVLLLGSGDEEDMGSENNPSHHHHFPLHHPHHPHPASSSSSSQPHLLEDDHGFGNHFGNHSSSSSSNFAYHQYGSSSGGGSSSNSGPLGISRSFPGGSGSGASSSSFDGSTAMEMALVGSSGTADDRHSGGGGMGRSSSVSSGISSGGGSGAAAAAAAGNLNWLVRDVGKSVLKLRDDLLVLHLQPHACPLSSARSRGLQGWQHYASNAIDEVQKSRSSSSSGSKRGAGSSNSSDRKSASMADPDYPVMGRPLVDGRHTMLEVAMFRHLQFDSLRRAKHATSMLLYHLHFPSHSLDAPCSSCGATLEGLRWHCSGCTDYDVCGDCSNARGTACPHGHPLTPYHVSSFE